LALLLRRACHAVNWLLDVILRGFSSGEWQVARSKWQVASGEWKNVESGSFHLPLALCPSPPLRPLGCGPAVLGRFCGIFFQCGWRPAPMDIL
jgi:hypothetical protein